MVGIAQGVNGQGLNLANLDETTQDEIDAYLTTRWRGRGPLYDQYAMSLMLDYAPDFAKLHWLAAECFRTMPSDPETYDPSFATPNSVQQLHSYMVLGWEMGIRNQFRVLRRLGFTRAQIMEIVMFGRLTGRHARTRSRVPRHRRRAAGLRRRPRQSRPGRRAGPPTRPPSTPAST